MNTISHSYSSTAQLSPLEPSLAATKTMLVSVVVPVYNGSKYIQKAIDSILSQTYKNYEIIVVDDGSTDDTRQKLHPYHDRIRYVFQANQGSAAARNLGISLAQGELIAFLDADDFWTMPEKLEKQVACFLADSELGGINTGWRIVDGEGKHIKTVQPWHKAPNLDLETWLKKKCVRTSAMVFRRQWLEKVGSFDPELRQSHDVDLILRLSLAGCKTIWLKEETVCYRQHDENTTKNNLKQATYIQAVLDKFFARHDLPKPILQQENKIKYHTLVWIAWYQYNYSDLKSMAKFLRQSLHFSPYLKAENITHWLTSFERFSQERGKNFDIDELTNSLEWQQLLPLTLGFTAAPSQKISDRQLESKLDSSDLSEKSRTEPQNADSKVSKSFERIKSADRKTRITEIQAKEAKKYQKAADLLRKEGKLEAAAVNYQKSLEINPNLWQSFHGLGDIWRKLNKFTQAIDCYQAALDINPGFFWSNYNLGSIFSKQQKIDAAIDALNSAEKIQPYNVKVHQKLSKLLQQKGELNAAKERQSIANNLQTDVVKTCLQIAERAERDSELDKACNCYQKVLEISPYSFSVYLKLGKILRQQGKIDKAIAVYQDALKIDRELPDIAAALKEAKALQAKKPKIAGIPDDFVIPPIVGENNDYTFIEDKVRDFVAKGKSYSLPVSIVIPVYNRKEILAKTLAGITHQTYPQDLIEIIVADDGSSDGVEEVIRKYEQYLEIIHVRQKDRGYRLSAVRNLGIRAAKHDCLIVIDCDMLPEPNFVEAYMKYFHVSDRVALIGNRRFVCTDEITDDQIRENINVALDLPDICTNNEIWNSTEAQPTQDWRIKIYEKTDYLKTEKYPFRAFVGATIAYSRKIADTAGLYDEDFQRWGEEDKEYGYRIYNAGFYFIPVLDAVGLHQEPPGGENENDRQGGKEITAKILEEKCPAGWYRKYEVDRIYEVPKVSIYIPSYNNGKFIKECIDSVLNQSFTDLEVCVCDDGSTDNTVQILEENYRYNPKVRWKVQANGGISKASNTAVQMCRGMYIGQLDSDDLLKPNAVETLVKYLDRHDVGCVYSGCERIDTEGNYLQDEYNWPIFSREKLLITMIVHHFRMFRRKDWMRTSGFDETLTNAVDYDIFLKLSEVCSFHHVNEMLYLRRIHGNNTSVVNVNQQDANNNIVVESALKRIGLDREWEIYPDPQQKRKISFRKKG